MTGGYRWLLSRALRIPLVILAIGGLVSFGAVNLFQALPKEFAPTEDRGFIIIPITAPEGSSLDYTRERVREVERAVKPLEDRGIVQTILSQVAPGFSRPAPVNAGLVIVRLVPWEQRDVKQQQVVQELQGTISGFPGARAFRPTHRPSASAASATSRSSSCSAGPTTRPCAAGATPS
jgi:multidrug efflux pump